MKGIRYIINEKNKRTAVVIDLKTIKKYQDQIHDFIDALIAESRKGEETISWKELKTQLKKKGKL